MADFVPVCRSPGGKLHCQVMSFDADALWDLYDDRYDDDRGHIVPEINQRENSAAPKSVPLTAGEEATSTLIQAIKIDPTLSISLHVPRVLLEDGCVAEVGNMVWDCSIQMSRYLRSKQPRYIEARDATKSINNVDYLIDLTRYDHIIELGSGLGLLGFAIYRQLQNTLQEKDEDTVILSNNIKQKLTLTDHVPELVDAMKKTAADERQNSPHCDRGGENGYHFRRITLDIQRLDWSDDNDPMEWIQPGESVLVIASEVLYEPCHADMLAGCIRRILKRSKSMDKSGILAGNFAERPGWIQFCNNATSLAEDEGSIINIRDLDLGNGGYELIDIRGGH